MNKRLESGTETNGAPTAVASPIPPEIQELLGPPPLLPNEDTKLYYALLGSLAQTIRPTDVIAWLLIRDLADHRIEIARYRRFKAALIKAPYDEKAEEELSDRRHTIEYICAELKKSAEEEKKVLAKSGKTPAEIEHLKQGIDNRVEAELAKAEIDKSEAEAKLANASPSEAEFVKEFHFWIDQHERIDRLLRAAEDRFSAALEDLIDISGEWVRFFVSGGKPLRASSRHPNRWTSHHQCDRRRQIQGEFRVSKMIRLIHRK
jgi:hypothetical protein